MLCKTKTGEGSLEDGIRREMLVCSATLADDIPCLKGNATQRNRLATLRLAWPTGRSAAWLERVLPLGTEGITLYRVQFVNITDQQVPVCLNLLFKMGHTSTQTAEFRIPLAHLRLLLCNRDHFVPGNLNSPSLCQSHTQIPSVRWNLAGREQRSPSWRATTGQNFLSVGTAGYPYRMLIPDSIPGTPGPKEKTR